MKKLEVLFCGWGQRWLLGTLGDNGRELLFEFSSEALVKGIELSPRHLKLRPQAYADFPAHQHRLPGLIADALPDGWGMLLMDRLFAASGLDRRLITPLDRLAFIADRAMGALAFQPASNIALPPADLALLTLAKEIRAVVTDKDSTALKQLVLLGGSPHGARPKALVQYELASDRISTHPLAVGMPWLIKFPAKHEHKEVCAIEHLYAQLARLCQLDMPATQYFDIDKSLAAFGIARFDRHDGMRVPVHSLAGALHADFRIPGADYQTFLRITRALTHSEREVEKAFERCVFNVIFNNRDDHTKNFAYRMDAHFNWKLAPCYDLSYNEGAGGEHQMDIEGEGRCPAKTHLLQLAVRAGVGQAWAAAVIERIATVAQEFKMLMADYPIRVATRNRMVKAVEDNCRRMI